MKRKGGRRAAPALVDAADTREFVGLRVAAAYLGLHPSTVAARAESGELLAVHDHQVWRFAVRDLVRYRREHLTLNGGPWSESNRLSRPGR
jgi:hypothetical protein